MDWKSGRRSDNVDDQRSGGGAGRVALGGGMVVVIVVVGALLGKSPSEILSLLDQANQGAQSSAPEAPSGGAPAGPDDVGKDFVRSVLASTEDVWGQVFQASGQTYAQPRLVLFRDAVQSACGLSESAVGPFYCPPDRRVYLDLEFFDELAQRFRAPGEFARAYVIAHEVGHHVQNVLGIERQVTAQRQGLSAAGKNALSVRVELQADCFAGVWAFHAQRQRPFLQEGDLEAALAAATAIGDDRLQKQARGTVVPESFTHGSSAQRVRWFREGFANGSVKGCDTFGAEAP
jgi:predicted metalloprotease